MHGVCVITVTADSTEDAYKRKNLSAAPGSEFCLRKLRTYQQPLAQSFVCASYSNMTAGTVAAEKLYDGVETEKLLLSDRQI